MKRLFQYIKQMRRHAFAGFAAGLLNGFLGAGGGMVVVPMLEKNGLKPSEAHATSIAVIVPLCVLSAGLYMYSKSLNFADALPYLPAGLVGAFLGAKALPKIPDGLLRRIFGAFMLYAAFRLLWR
jgi:Predicted permeases